MEAQIKQLHLRLSARRSSGPEGGKKTAGQDLLKVPANIPAMGSFIPGSPPEHFQVS